MSIVYVVQRQWRFDEASQTLVPRYDLGPAEEFGELRIILADRTSIERPGPIITKMDLFLKDYSDQDYLLLIGHPALIGWATALAAARNNGRLRQLIWNSSIKKYHVVESYLPVVRDVV